MVFPAWAISDCDSLSKPFRDSNYQKDLLQWALVLGQFKFVVRHKASEAEVESGALGRHGTVTDDIQDRKSVV